MRAPENFEAVAKNAVDWILPVTYLINIIVLSQLRDIEILVQQQVEVLEGEGKDDNTLREIQKILYSTEVRNPDSSHLIIPFALITLDHALFDLQEGFEVPEAGAPLDEEETF